MSTVVALHWNTSALQYVVARNGRVESYASVDLEPGSSASSIGKRLADQLSQQISGRVQTVVTVSRSALQWQHLALPPCPSDELPDLVRMQSDRELGVSDDEDVGFDYLPLSGDEHTPYQVLTVAVTDAELQRIRQVCREANLTLDRIIPLAAGWPALTTQAGVGDAKDGVFVAPLANEAAVWATQAGKVMLFRQFQYPHADDAAQKAKAIGSELRRTQLSLSQHANFSNPTIHLVGDRQTQHAQLAQDLNSQLDTNVQTLGVIDGHDGFANVQTVTPQLMPLAGIALEQSQGKTPLVDMLNPRRKPKAKINYRTYALAGVAAALLALMLGWSGYRNLNQPLEKAAEDRAAIALLEESREQLASYEKDAGAVRDWLSESPNLLVHLEHLSQAIRPEGLQADEFPLDRDVALQKLNLDKRQLVIDAIARNDRAVQPFENRLREASYSPERGRSGPSKQDGYAWQFQSIIEIDSSSDAAAREEDPVEVAADESSEEKPAEEPQS